MITTVWKLTSHNDVTYDVTAGALCLVLRALSSPKLLSGFFTSFSNDDRTTLCVN